MTKPHDAVNDSVSCSASEQSTDGARDHGNGNGGGHGTSHARGNGNAIGNDNGTYIGLGCLIDADIENVIGNAMYMNNDFGLYRRAPRYSQ